ncbi:MAG: hypothetical protein J0H00_19790 [Burkholderiales bacterium]|nr:hypothetical protein [Burkholderiales bacterium]
MNENIPELNRRLTERQALITGTRWCMSCSQYRRADGGSESEVSAGRGRRKRIWKCAVCTQGRRR